MIGGLENDAGSIKLGCLTLLFATFLQSLLDDSTPNLLKLSAGDGNSPEIRKPPTLLFLLS